MEITVKGKNFDITEALRSHATSKVAKTSRYSDAVITAEVQLSLERNWHIAEVTLFGKGFDMHFEDKSKDMYNSIDRVVEKLERQLKKQREKVSSHRPGRTEALVAPEVDDSPKSKTKKAEKSDPFMARIESITRFNPHNLTVDEAIKELEADGAPFYCFLNEDDGNLSIVYKKGRGYALMVPNP